ncbi:MAG: RNA polymerase sigma factor [Actinomycetota bacterium]
MEEDPPDAGAIRESISDPDRFAIIFDRHFDAIFAYLRRRVDRSIAEDIAAEVFVRAFAQRSRFDSRRESARPWLLGISANLLKHHWRSERRQLKAYAKSGVDPVSEWDSSRSDDRLDADASAPALASALANLDHRERETLLLFVWGDLSYEETADALGISLAAVKSRIHRARRKLRKLIPLDRERT